MPKFLGRATIRAAGTVIKSAKGASLDIGGTKRTPVVVGGVVGWSEETVPSMLECETALEAGMSLRAISNLAGVTVTFEADTGQRYVISDAFHTDTPTMKDGEGGNVAIKMAGPPAEEVL
ncbi:phage tail tube protein [Pararoseomonas sp. SCSIO 73927]|uniref:phage tail tube protein n=1 Tax=Pararoseomonas sp. SCSIO 73927 TaxID=3114537 RepID=UPI0030CDC523